jgi:hypothetical protein
VLVHAGVTLVFLVDEQVAGVMSLQEVQGLLKVAAPRLQSQQVDI